MNRWAFQIELKDITYLDKIIKDINTVLGFFDLHPICYKPYPNIIIVAADVKDKRLLNYSILNSRVKKSIQKYTKEYNILNIEKL